MYILWRHLQFYLVHCRPADMDSSLGVAGVGRTAMRRMQGKWQERGGVKREESGRMRIHVGGGDCVVWNERDMIC